MDPIDMKSWADLLNSPLPTLWGIGIATTIAWYSASYNQWLGLCALVFLCVAGAHSIARISPWIKEKISEIRAKRAMKERIRTLSKPEKELLREFVENDSRSRHLAMTDNTVASLHGYGLLTLGSSVSAGDIYFPFMVNGIAWDYIRENPEVLEVDEEEIAA